MRLGPGEPCSMQLDRNMSASQRTLGLLVLALVASTHLRVTLRQRFGRWLLRCSLRVLAKARD